MINFEKPLVTVIIPAYNHESWVKEAVLSVINQTYGKENIQLIVTDDYSTDSTPTILRELATVYNFKLILHKQNLGVCATLNEMISLSKGKYISGLASDDVMLLDRLDNQVNILQKNPEIDILGGSSLLIDANGKVITNKSQNFDYSLISYNFNQIFLLKWPGLSAGSVIIKSDLFLKIGNYDSNYKIEDYYFWLKATYNSAKLVYCNLPFVYYRIHSKSISSNEALINLEIFKILAIYKDHPYYLKALQNRELYILTKKVINCKMSVLKYLIKHPALFTNIKIFRLLIMLLVPSFILNRKFYETYSRLSIV